MKIIFEIPDEFIKDWKKDRFEDSLQRLSVDAHCLAGLYDQEVAIMLINEFKKAVEVKYGKWVPDDRKITVNCSECGAAEWYINSGKFCSNCGAQMEVEE